MLGMKMQTSLLLLLLVTAALTVDSTNRDAAAQDVRPRLSCCPGGAPRVPGDIVECKWQGKGRCATEAYVVKTTHTNTWQCISKDSVWLKKQLKTRSIKCN